MDELWGLATHPNQHHFATCGDDKSLFLWDTLSHSAVWSIELPVSRRYSIVSISFKLFYKTLWVILKCNLNTSGKYWRQLWPNLGRIWHDIFVPSNSTDYINLSYTQINLSPDHIASWLGTVVSTFACKPRDAGFESGIWHWMIIAQNSKYEM